MPQVVSRVRFSPLNADNGVHAGEKFRLHYWDDGWKTVGISETEYEYVPFRNVPKNKVYWLENQTTGKEETPFVMKNGEQCFLYGGLI